MDILSDGDSDSDVEPGHSEDDETRIVPASLAVTQYNNELFDNDDLDEEELGGDFASSLDTESFCDSPGMPCMQDDSASQLELIRILAARRRRERSSSGKCIVSNDFILPRSSLTRTLQVKEWQPSTFQGGRVSGRGESEGASAMAAKVDKLKVPPVLADSLRSQHAKKPQLSPTSSSRYSCGSFEDDCVRPEEAKDLERQLLEQGIAPFFDPGCAVDVPTDNFKTALSSISDLRIFLLRPGPKDAGIIQCHIRREIQANWRSPRYKLQLTEGDCFLLAARKRKKTKCSNYIISLDEDDITEQTGNYFGKVRSNFLGTEFWFYDKGPRPSPANKKLYQFQISERVELGAVTYLHNVLGMRGPRKMLAIIPSLDEEDKPFVFPRQDDGSHIILQTYNLGQDRDKMVIMHNKSPKWNAEIGAYCLNFNGRVTRASVKNFQLVTDEDKDHVVLQFGKVGRDFFTMDYQYPMSALQGRGACPPYALFGWFPAGFHDLSLKLGQQAGMRVRAWSVNNGSISQEGNWTPSLLSDANGMCGAVIHV